MKKIYLFLIPVLFCLQAAAQTTELQDTVTEGKVTVYKDSRLDILAKKEAAFNEANGYSLGPRSAKGYRLMLLSTNDRPAAMRLRAELLQRFPEQKVYMSFQPPYIKLRFGNFADKGATVEAVHLLRKHLAPNIQIKASGGIKTYTFAKQLIDAGATRLGCSSSINIVNEAAQQN